MPATRSASSVKADWNLSAIGAAFAEAAVDPSRWGAAMETVAEDTGAFGAVLFPIRGKLPDIPFTASLGPSFEAYIHLCQSGIG